MHSHIGCICLVFPHCAFSSVSSNCLHEGRQSHIGCICLTFLHCAFSNVSSKSYETFMGCKRYPKNDLVVSPWAKKEPLRARWATEVDHSHQNHRLKKVAPWVCTVGIRVRCVRFCHRVVDILEFLVDIALKSLFVGTVVSFWSSLTPTPPPPLLFFQRNFSNLSFLNISLSFSALFSCQSQRKLRNLQNFYAIPCNPWISSAMAMAMSIYRTLCVLVWNPSLTFPFSILRSF